jgi:hypothetical protein
MRKRLWMLYLERTRPYPLIVFARVHGVVPFVLLGLLVALAVGSMASHDRLAEPASVLLREAGLPHEKYDALMKKARGTEAAKVPSDADKTTMALLALAQAAKLRNCAPVGDERSESERKLVRSEDPIVCDGPRFDYSSVPFYFVLFVIGMGLVLVGWLSVLVSEAWMLPRFAASLWYTPLYAVIMGALASPPFVMVATFYAREPAGPIQAERFAMTQPDLQILVVVILVLTWLVVSIIDLRVAGAVTGSISGVLLFAGLAVALALTSGTTDSFLLVLEAVIIGGALLFAAVAWKSVAAWLESTVRPTGVLDRMGRLGRGLELAVALLLLRLGLDAAGLHVTAIDRTLEVLCYAACVLYLLRSRANERGVKIKFRRTRTPAAVG